MILKLFEVFFFPALIFMIELVVRSSERSECWTQDEDGDEVYEQRQEEGYKPQ